MTGRTIFKPPNGLIKCHYTHCLEISQYSIGCCLFCAYQLVNSSLTKVSYGTVTITHEPLPYEASVSLSTGDISQIILEPQRYKGRGRRRYFDLGALTNDGEKLKVLRYIETKGQAVFINNEIERFVRPGSPVKTGE